MVDDVDDGSICGDGLVSGGRDVVVNVLIVDFVLG
jgi:hypothetical protein